MNSKKMNYHTHTIYCDGKNTAEEMVLSAIDKGFSVLGFSGHSYTSIDERYCMSIDDTKKYIDDVNRLKEKYRDKIEILCGIELDYFSEEITDNYDYVIGSVHYLEKDGKFYSIDGSANHFETLLNAFSNDIQAVICEYYKLIGDVVNRTNADIIGHFDLVSKFNDGNKYFDEKASFYIEEANKAIDKLLLSRKIFEINTGAIARGVKKLPYPSLLFIKRIEAGGGKFILTSDCHDKEKLDCYFDEAEKLCSPDCLIKYNPFKR